MGQSAMVALSAGWGGRSRKVGSRGETAPVEVGVKEGSETRDGCAARIGWWIAGMRYGRRAGGGGCSGRYREGNWERVQLEKRRDEHVFIAGGLTPCRRAVRWSRGR